MKLKWSLLLLSLLLLSMLVPASLFANTLYFPQVVFGSGFSTSFVIINNGSTDVSSQVNFYGQNGVSLPALTLPVSVKTGATARFTIPDAGLLTVVWGELAAGAGTLQGIAIFDLRASDGILVTTAGVSALEANSRFVLPVDITSSSTAGIAIANTSLASLNVRVRLINEGIPDTTTTITIPPHGQIAKLADEIFSLSTAGFRGTLGVDVPGSSDNVLAATALSVKEGIFSTLPVLPGRDCGTSGTLYFPQVAFGGNFSTSFVLINTGTNPIASAVNFYDQRGNFRAEFTEPVVLQPGASKRFTRQSAGDLTVLWGELAVGSGVAQGVASFDWRAGNGTLVSTAGVLGTRSGSTFLLPVDVTAKSSTGVAIANVSTSIDANVRLHLLNEDGSEAAISNDPRFSTLGAGAQVAGFVESFFPQLNGTTFRGALVVEAPAPIVATALTVKEGLLSALPVAPGGSTGSGGGITCGSD